MSRFIHIVDDEASVRDSLRVLLSTRQNLHIVPFVSGDVFVEALDGLDPGVVLLDINMPGRSGMDVLRELRERRVSMAVVVVTGQGDVTLAVEAMKLGAVDFLEKPYDHQALFASIDAAFDRLDQSARDSQRRDRARAKLEQLTLREREVIEQVVQGQPNKAVANLLDISVRTVEVYRAKAMEKLDVTSLPEAVRLAFTAGLIS